MKTQKLKKYAPRTIERLNKKANREYILGQCPKCGDDMNSMLEHYEGSDVVCYWYCEKCNLGVTHSYGWLNAEVTHHKEDI